MEGSIIPINPENVNPKGWAVENPTGTSIPRGPLSPSSSDDKVQSRYLRPSMGSCHDFCKYGRKHASEEEKRSMLRRFLRNKLVPDGEQNQVSSLNQEERRKRTVTKLKATSKVPKQEPLLPGQQIGLSETPMDIQSETPSPTRRSNASAEKTMTKLKATSTVPRQKSLLPGKHIGLSETLVDIKSETPSPTRKNIVSAEKTNLRSRGSERNQVKSLNPGNGKKTKVTRPRIPLQPKPSPDKVNVIKPKDLSPFAMFNDSKLDIIKKKTMPPIKKSFPSVVPKVIRQKAPPSVNKSVASTKSPTINHKTSLPPQIPDVSAKPAVFLKKKAPLLRSISQLNHSRHLRRNRLNKITNSQDASKIGEKKVVKLLTSSFSSKTPGDVLSILKPRKPRIVKRASSVKNREKVGKAKHDSSNGKEKKLDNTELESEKKSNEEGENEESGSVVSGVSDGELLSNSKIEASTGREKRLRRTTTARPEENVPKPYKLKFKRGKVIDLRSESIGARRIRFRRVRMAGENPSSNGEVGRRSFRRRRDVSGEESKLEAQSVVLKHQGMEEKKDMQVLFNNVIEETASKLVESRKSKVKALVGAFETVISLQESKPASAV